MELALGLGALLGIGGAGAAAAAGVGATAAGIGASLAAGGAASLATGLAAAGTVGATAAGLGGALAGVGGIFAGGSLLAKIASGALTAYSAGASIAGGMAAESEGRIEAHSAAIDASRAKIAGEDEALRINRALAEAVGDSQAAYAAAGISIGSGTPAQARQEARRRANEDLTISRSNMAAKVYSFNQRGETALRRGANARKAGVVQALSDIGRFGGDIANRGRL